MALRRKQQPDININDLDYHVVYQICQDFDIDRSWELLAAAIGYSTFDIQTFDLETRRPDGSPTKKLLWDWGQRNATVRNLYDKLALINKTRCMSYLEHIMKDEKAKLLEKQKKEQQEQTSLLSKDTNASSLDDRESCIINPNNLPIPTMKKPKIPADENVNLNTCNSSDKGGVKQMKFNKVIEVMVNHPQGAASVEMNASLAAGPASAKENLEAASSSIRSLERVKSVLEENGANILSTPRLSHDENEIARALISTPSYTYKELSQATGGFNVEHRLGQGKFGCVYLGLVKNTKCAIKKLKTRQEKLEEEQSSAHLASELKALSRYHHESLVSLYGYALDGFEVCLVYQYMQNGSLDDCLHCKNGRNIVLTWEQRLSILRGAACGLQFLHTVEDKPVIHGDIKSANILLDRHFEAKIGDLGLAQQATSGENGQKTHITKKTTTVFDYINRAYLAPEQIRGNTFSIKGDTYAFGVVMFECLTGQEAYDARREGDVEDKYLVAYLLDTLAQKSSLDQQNFEDPRLSKPFPTTMFIQLFDIAKKSTCSKKKDRPNMTEVYADIEKLEVAYHGQEYSNVQELKTRSQPKENVKNKDLKEQNLETSSLHTSYTSAGYMPGLKTGRKPLPKVILPKPEADAGKVLSPIDMLDKDQEPPIAFKLQMVHDQKGDINAVKEKIASEDKEKPRTVDPEYENVEKIEKKMRTVYISEAEGRKVESDLPESDPEKEKCLEKFDEKNFAESYNDDLGNERKGMEAREDQKGLNENEQEAHTYVNVVEMGKSATESEDTAIDDLDNNDDEPKEQSEHEENEVADYTVQRDNLDLEYEAIAKKAKGSLLDNLFANGHDFDNDEECGELECYDDNSETSTITESMNNDADTYNSAEITDDDLFDQGCPSKKETHEHDIETDFPEASLEKHQHNYARYSQMTLNPPSYEVVQMDCGYRGQYSHIDANISPLPPEPYHNSLIPGSGAFYGPIISHVPEGFQDSFLPQNLAHLGHMQSGRTMTVQGGFNTGCFQVMQSVESGPGLQMCSGGFGEGPHQLKKMNVFHDSKGNQLNDMNAGNREPTEGDDCYV